MMKTLLFIQIMGKYAGIRETNFRANWNFAKNYQSFSMKTFQIKG